MMRIIIETDGSAAPTPQLSAQPSSSNVADGGAAPLDLLQAATTSAPGSVAGENAGPVPQWLIEGIAATAPMTGAARDQAADGGPAS